MAQDVGCAFGRLWWYAGDRGRRFICRTIRAQQRHDPGSIGITQRRQVFQCGRVSLAPQRIHPGCHMRCGRIATRCGGGRTRRGTWVGANHAVIVPRPGAEFLADDAEVGGGGFAQLLRVVGAVSSAGVGTGHQLLGKAFDFLRCGADGQQTGDLGKHGIHIKTHRVGWKVAIP